MAEPHLKHGALAHLGLEARAVAELGAADVALSAMPQVTQIGLRGDGEDRAFLQAVEGVLGFALPIQPNTTASSESATAFWLGPSEWLLCLPGAVDRWIAPLSEALAGQQHAINDVSESRVRIRVAGPRARELLAKGTSLDLHPDAFAAGGCAQSTLALTDVLLHRPEGGPPAFDVYVHRSVADYLWRWLEGAGAEYGLAVLTAPEAG